MHQRASRSPTGNRSLHTFVHAMHTDEYYELCNFMSEFAACMYVLALSLPGLADTWRHEASIVF
eukprot:scaffold55069_cov20-Prasinocladus_malaysianus.AAC.2